MKRIIHRLFFLFIATLALLPIGISRAAAINIVVLFGSNEVTSYTLPPSTPGTVSWKIKLAAKPGNAVTVKVSSSGDFKATFPQGSSFLFQPSDFSTPKDFSFKTPSGLKEGQSVTLTFSGSGLVAKKIKAGVTASGLSSSDKIAFSPTALKFETDKSEKKIVTATVTPAPTANLTVKLVANGKVTLGKTTLTFSSTDTTDTFGVTPASGLKNGDVVIITAEGKIGTVTYRGMLEATMGVAVHRNPNAGKIDFDKLPGTTITDLNVFLNKAIRGATWVITFMAFIGLIAAGFMYITAGGDTAKAEKARKTIIWSIVGVILASISYTLLLTAAQFKNIDYTAIPQDTSGSDPTTDGSTTTGSGVGLTVSDTAGTDFAGLISLDQATQLSFPLEAVLNSAPTSTVTVELLKQGNLPLTLVGSSTMTFDETNWSTTQSFGISYAGDGQPGQAGQVLLKGSDGSRQIIRFEVPNV